MIHTFPIEFLRIALEQTLLKKHIENPNYFGGKNQIQLFSFFEQLKNQDEVDRFVERFRDLTEQQNRTNLIGNGILMSPENPTITNLYSSLIIPMTWTASIRTMLENRDQMIETLFELINELKGAKVDIAELKCLDENGKVYYEPFAVGTIGHNENAPAINCGDYIGDYEDEYTEDKNGNYNNSIAVSEFLEDGDDLVYSGTITISQADANTITIRNIVCSYSVSTTIGSNSISYQIRIVNGAIDPPSDDVGIVVAYSYKQTTGNTLNSYIVAKLSELTTLGVINNLKSNDYIYCGQLTSNKIVVAMKVSGVWTEIEDDGSYENVIFPPEHEDFVKYKLSLSFDSLRCDTPKTLNGKEYCELSFGGSATLVNYGVKLGNDLVKISMQKNKILAESDITFTNATIYYLEPLEMPSGNGANTIPNQLISNAFKVNSHTDSLTITLQYTFIADEEQPILKQLFDYGRYGTLGTTSNDISPNIIYNMAEWWSSWGNVEKKNYLGKIIESVDIENTESDTLTLSLTMQVQGENN